MMTIRHRRLLISAAGATLSGCVYEPPPRRVVVERPAPVIVERPAPVIVERPAPPPVIVEPPPPPPPPLHPYWVWHPGHWVWEGRWVWHPGHYAERLR